MLLLSPKSNQHRRILWIRNNCSIGKSRPIRLKWANEKKMKQTLKHFVCISISKISNIQITKDSLSFKKNTYKYEETFRFEKNVYRYFLDFFLICHEKEKILEQFWDPLNPTPCFCYKKTKTIGNGKKGTIVSSHYNSTYVLFIFFVWFMYMLYVCICLKRPELTNLKNIWWSSVAKEVKSKESGNRIPPIRDKIRTFFLRHKFTT